MEEGLNLFKILNQLDQRSENAVLATVVRTSGSTYRKEGAKLLITESGAMHGNISAGCLENDVREIAAQVIRSGRCRLLKYDNTASEEVIWGLGLGCNGIVEIFVAPVFLPGSVGTMRDILKLAVDEQARFAVAKVIAGENDAIVVSTQRLFLADGSQRGDTLPDDLQQQVGTDALRLLEMETSKTMSYLSHGVDIYIESFVPRPRVIIIGGDPDSEPITRLAAQLGFKVVLVDHREHIVNQSNYPEADELHVLWPEDIGSAFTFDATDFVLIKTHNYLKDKEILKTVLKSGAGYVGQMGPKARLQDLLDELKKEGVEFSEAELNNLHGPVGLDIGAESPEQIAVSIMSEIVAVKNRRGGIQLKHQDAPIHPRKIETGGLIFTNNC